MNINFNFFAEKCLIEDDTHTVQTNRRSFIQYEFSNVFGAPCLDDDGAFVHAMLKRPEVFKTQRYNSDYFNFFTSCFSMFCS